MDSSKISVHKKEYISIFICWLTYTFIYFGRYSYSANIGLIEEFYGKSHSQAGMVMTFFSVAYGTGQILHGFFVKKYPKKFVVPLAVFIAAVIDFLVFYGVPFYLVKYLWLVSAFFQAALWPCVLQTISENVSDTLMQKAIIVMSTTTTGGVFLVYGTSALFAKINFKYTFLAGAVILLIVSLLWLLLYEKGDCLNETPNKKQQDLSRQRVNSLLLILPIILMCIFSIITNFEKDGLQTWVPVILKSLYNMKDNLSIILTLVLPVFGIFGAAFSIFMRKRIKSTVLLVLFLFLCTAFFNIAVILFKDNIVILLGCFGTLELLLHGLANIITSVFPLSMRKVFSSGSLAGIINGSAYAGSALSSFALGKIADISGWNAVFVTLLGTAVAALVIGAIYSLISFKNPKLKERD